MCSGHGDWESRVVGQFQLESDPRDYLQSLGRQTDINKSRAAQYILGAGSRVEIRINLVLM